MVCLGLKPGVAGWKAQTNPLSYGSIPFLTAFAMNFPSLKMGNLMMQIKTFSGWEPWSSG